MSEISNASEARKKIVGLKMDKSVMNVAGMIFGMANRPFTYSITTCLLTSSSTRLAWALTSASLSIPLTWATKSLFHSPHDSNCDASIFGGSFYLVVWCFIRIVAISLEKYHCFIRSDPVWSQIPKIKSQAISRVVHIIINCCTISVIYVFW